MTPLLVGLRTAPGQCCWADGQTRGGGVSTNAPDNTFAAWVLTYPTTGMDWARSHDRKYSVIGSWSSSRVSLDLQPRDRVGAHESLIEWALGGSRVLPLLLATSNRSGYRMPYFVSLVVHRSISTYRYVRSITFCMLYLLMVRPHR